MAKKKTETESIDSTEQFTSQDMIEFGCYLMRDEVIRSKKSEDRRTITETDLVNFKAFREDK